MANRKQQTPISSFLLINELGFKLVRKFQWQKGYTVIKYNGTDWTLHDLTIITTSPDEGQKINYLEEIPS